MNLKSNFFEKKGGNIRIAHDEANASKEIALTLQSNLPSSSIFRPIVFVCIGTDRSTGDSLGPLIGTKLQDHNLHHVHVYGTLDEPIHAVNLVEKLAMIQSTHFNPFIIAVDACLGRLKSVGQLTVGDGPVMPGAGVKKDLPPVGDIHITGIVNVSGFMEFFVLQNTRLSLVMRMANVVAASIKDLDMALSRKDFLAAAAKDNDIPPMIHTQE
ncbi:putative sporulation protein YyaC [Bacillus tianshenii]|uniref:Sporulation protein YyaC n=1 Tax=Sutcliffiella tianshenii TaxID=1463404 RepID=A0ABS2NW21_9BACI|nr:spore protease YyaC [Bacillus tianshenii]MBM7618865.1 putative sporulation protein YyaC [Bacillus tianshenii]